MAGDWKTIDDEKERYAAYLCSREWAEKREAVRKRADGKCERCKILPMSACHHLTYARKYNEDLEDLQAICQACHDFTHGKSEFDPSSLHYCHRKLVGYLRGCKERGSQPVPMEFVAGISDLKQEYADCVKAARILCAADLENQAWLLCETLPFDMPNPRVIDSLPFDPNTISQLYQLAGFDLNCGGEFMETQDEDEP